MTRSHISVVLIGCLSQPLPAKSTRRQACAMLGKQAAGLSCWMPDAWSCDGYPERYPTCVEIAH